MKFRKLDLSHARRVFVVGDIHGSFSKLEKALENVDFDPELDHLVSVGDLIDRGPENERVTEFLNYPWFHAIQGNHEEMLIEPNFAYLSKQNGGEWFFDLSDKKQNRIRTALAKLPLIMEVLTPSGKRIGVCHASYPGEDWNDAAQIVEDDRNHQEIIWDRRRIKEVRLLGFGRTIKNIDHVFYGHTPLDGPFHAGNQSWIDTAAYHKSGYFTIIEVT
jgi:serine/threonine protein phosphatase 1